MDKRTLLAISLCFLIFAGWQEFYIKPQMQARQAAIQRQRGVQPTATAPGGSAVSSASGTGANAPTDSMATSAAPAEVAPQLETVRLATGPAKISNGPRLFADWDLERYRLPGDESRGDLQKVIHQAGALEFAVDAPEYAYIANRRGKLESAGGSWRWSYEDDKVALTRMITTAEGQAYADVVYAARFKQSAPRFAFVSLAAASPEKDEEERDRELIWWANDEIGRTVLSGGIEEPKEYRGPVGWIGAASRYFVLAAVNRSEAQPQALVQPLGARGGRISLKYAMTGPEISVSLRVYFGPKELDLLRSVEPTLDHTVNFGMFTIIAYPLLRLMKWFHELTRNWGIAIILLTLIVRLAVYPLAFKSAKSMKHMQKINPQLQKIREKYKDDKQKLNEEMLTLMRTHGYNPMAGCLPVLVQMPVFFALYQVLYSAIELYQAPFALWIHDLSQKDPFYVTPVLLTLVMFFQMRLTPTPAADPMQQKIMQWMPVMFGVFMLTLPSGLTLYMLVSTLFGIAQQLIINKKIGIVSPPIAGTHPA
jgi:YidC/Oxa1 family membrane protein insertase